MFIKNGEISVNSLLADTIARLLFLNALFVIAGYGLANATGGSFTGVAKVFKSIFFSLSILQKLPGNQFLYSRILHRSARGHMNKTPGN